MWVLFGILCLDSVLGIRNSNPNFHVQSVACCRCTNPQSDGYFTTKSRKVSYFGPYFLFDCLQRRLTVSAGSPACVYLAVHLRAARRVLSSISSRINNPLETACRPKK